MSARLAYFFKHDRYLRYDLDRKVVDAGPALIGDLWPALPVEFRSDLDAVVNWGEGHAYFFKGSRYLRFDTAKEAVDVGPLAIADAWDPLPVEFKSDLDAVVNWGEGHAHFFKGARSLRYDKDLKVVDAGPALIGDLWPALPVEFRSDLDAVVNWGEGHAYFFKGGRYLRFDINQQVVDVGPLAIADAWDPLPAEFKSDLAAVVLWTWVDHWEQVPVDHRLAHVMGRLVTEYGFPAAGAAGLVGNLVAESAVIPPRIEGSAAATPRRAADFAGKLVVHSASDIMNRNAARKIGPKLPGIGLAQWTSQARRAGVFTHPYGGVPLGAAAVFNMDAQIDYLVHELQTQYAHVRSILLNSHTTIDAACDEVVYNFEIPGSILVNGHKLPRTDPRVQKVFNQRRPFAHQASHAFQAPQA
jgi:hypothetical protein